MAFFFEHGHPEADLLDSSNSHINIRPLQPAMKKTRVASNESLRRQFRRPGLQESYSVPRPRDTMDGASDNIKPLSSTSSVNSTPASPSLLRFSEAAHPGNSILETTTQHTPNTAVAAPIVTADVASHTLTGHDTSSTSASLKQGVIADKPLPSKPVGPGSEEPEPRGIIDATDAHMKSVNFASLTPKSSRDVLSGSTGRRSITPNNARGTGSPTLRKVTRKSSRTDLRGSRAPSQQGQRRISSLPSASENTKALPGQHGHAKRQSIGAVTIDRGEAVVNKTVARAASFISNDASSPGLEPDDKVRRRTSYGVGVTMKVSLEANKTILGQSPRAARHKPKANTRTGQQDQHELILRLTTPEPDILPQLTRKSKTEQKKAPYQSDLIQFPPRISSLTNSSAEELKKTHKKGPSFGSRLARPTAASAAREIEAKKKVSEAEAAQLLGLNEKTGTLTSVKKAGAGFRSRFNSFLPGRLRSNSNASSQHDMPVMYQNPVSRHLSPVPEPRSGSRNTSKRDGTPTELTRVRTNKRFSLESIGEVKVPKTRSERSPTVASHPSHDAIRDEAGSALNNYIRFHSHHPHESLDTAPNSSSSGGSDTRFEEVYKGGDHIDGLVRDAEGHLRRILEIAQGIQDPGMRSHVSAIAEALGEAIQATRSLRMASIAAATTNANLALVTKSLSAAAATAIANLG